MENTEICNLPLEEILQQVHLDIFIVQENTSNAHKNVQNVLNLSNLTCTVLLVQGEMLQKHQTMALLVLNELCYLMFLRYLC